ncbi:hypothetical protein SeLEV6574_g02207 [Synchytrium endobioticum]|uniref:Uncharacterized protein n=1 Tax=Synchytrium endobioticum TaxID=286115 RepID=A0A507DB69_9FUNG|nr:hypothetical protein SeLEV6574_g02207 [Synchytrium endobioticum]
MSLNIKSLTINGNGGNLLGICQDPQKHYDEPRMFKSGTRSPKVVPFRCWKKNRKSTPSSSKSGGEIPDTQRLKTWIAKLALARRTTNSWFSRSKTIRNTTEQEGIIDTSATKMKRKLALKTLSGEIKGAKASDWLQSDGTETPLCVKTAKFAEEVLAKLRRKIWSEVNITPDPPRVKARNSRKTGRVANTLDQTGAWGEF